MLGGMSGFHAFAIFSYQKCRVGPTRATPRRAEMANRLVSNDSRFSILTWTPTGSWKSETTKTLVPGNVLELEKGNRVGFRAFPS